jgi:GTPase
MKTGFVILAGRSNVGKSTLINALVGSKVAIVTPKPQTTRHPVRGVLHDPRGQIVFVDTPGIFLGKKDAVSKRLNDLVKESLDGIDAVVYVTDPTRPPGKEEALIQSMLQKIKTPVIVVRNKSDVVRRSSFVVRGRPTNHGPLTTDIGQIDTLDISAKTHNNLNRLVDALFDILPEGDAYYPDLQMTDITHKQWLEEVIREKCFLALDQELPYSVKVVVEDIDIHADGSRYVQANILTTEERYKGMIIGVKASKLKDIGRAARKEIEAATGAKLFLELNVKVDAKWQQRFR